MPIGAALGAVAAGAAGAAGAGAIGAGLAGAAASAAGGLISGALQGGAVDSSADQARGISQEAIDRADANRTADRANFQPFVDQGTAGLTSLGNLLGVNGQDAATAARSNFQASPGYEYQLGEGLRAVDAGAAAKGMLRSGATLKAEQTLGSNLADQDFGSYLGRLTSLAGLGITGAQGEAGTTQTFNALLNPQTTNAVNTTTGQGTADASIYGNTAKNVISAVGNSGLFNKAPQSTVGMGTYLGGLY